MQLGEKFNPLILAYNATQQQPCPCFLRQRDVYEYSCTKENVELMEKSYVIQIFQKKIINTIISYAHPIGCC